jgi:hypothetical protein
MRIGQSRDAPLAGRPRIRPDADGVQCFELEWIERTNEWLIGWEELQVTVTFMTRIYVAWLALALLLTVWPAATAHAAVGSDRSARQAELDAACEKAREQKLAPLRAEFVEECVREKQQQSREACEAFYADYGAQAGNRAPLFYDLPECVEAFEYQKGQRQR